MKLPTKAELEIEVKGQKCSKCNKNPARVIDMLDFWRIGECEECTPEKTKINLKEQRAISRRIEVKKEDRGRDRVKYAKELIQPYRQGEFSKEYKDAYPDISRRMVKDKVITQKQYDKAKPTWRGDVPGL